MKDLLSLVNCLSTSSLRADLQILSNGIFVPRLTEEFDTFSVQGNLMLSSNCPKIIKKISLQFRGSIDRLKTSGNVPQKSAVIENYMELLEKPIHIPKSGSSVSFELALPRSLPPSVNSEFFKLKYSMMVFIECEDTKTPFNFPVQVYNHHLIPHYEARLDNFFDSGTIKDVMDYTINFSKRFFTKDELIPFKILIQPSFQTQFIHITAKLVQKVSIMNDSTQIPVEEKPHTINLSKETVYFKDKLSINELEFYLPILKKSSKSILPTMDSTYFEVAHAIELIINYHVNGQLLTKYCAIKVPIAIATQLNDSMVELPDYCEIGNSELLPINELPPIYTK